jgi:hypothetical protein
MWVLRAQSSPGVWTFSYTASLAPGSRTLLAQAEDNGAYFLNTSTVQDDASVDVLMGGSGLDWFFADTTGQSGPRDIVLGLQAGDILTNV